MGSDLVLGEDAMKRRGHGGGGDAARLAESGITVIGIASGVRIHAVRAVGTLAAVDPACEDVGARVLEITSGRKAAAVFDPIGAATYETNIGLLAPRGCLVEIARRCQRRAAAFPRGARRTQ